MAPTPLATAAPVTERTAPTPSPWGAWSAALILVLGSALFLAGGRAHPAINASLGAGPEEFFRGFAHEVQHTPGWHAMHMLILLGPLCWALGAPALLETMGPHGRAATSAARTSLILSATLWAVAFVLDGFGAPVYAEALLGAASPAAAQAVLTSFAANAIMMSRLGLLSWIFGGLGILLIAGELVARGARTRWRMLTGAVGIALGAWPLIATFAGEYAAGPFTSRYWMPNALAVGLWYVALGACALGGSKAHPTPGEISGART